MRNFKQSQLCIRFVALICAICCVASYSNLIVRAESEGETEDATEDTTVDNTDENTNELTALTANISTKKEPLYNDPMFTEQYYFYDSNILPIHERRVSNEKVKVAVYDGDFGSLDYDVAFSDYIPEKGIPKYDESIGFHGAGVCSIIGLIPNDGIGGVGIANNCEVIPYQVEHGCYSTEDVIRDCLEHDVKIIVSSHIILSDYNVLKEFSDKGGIIITGAGNDPMKQVTDYDPEAVYGLDLVSEEERKECVTYREEKGALKSFSHNIDTGFVWKNMANWVRLYGDDESLNLMIVTAVKCSGELDTVCYGAKRVTIAAPVYSTMYFEGGYNIFSATSFAAPVVGGTVVLLQSYFPTATTKQIRQAIVSSAFRSAALKDKCQAGGTLNAYGAMLELERMLLSKEYKTSKSNIITDGEYYIRNTKTGEYLSFSSSLGNDKRANHSDDCGAAEKFKVEVTKDLNYVIIPEDGGDHCLTYNTDKYYPYISDFGEDANCTWTFKYTENGYHINSNYSGTSLTQFGSLLGFMDEKAGNYKSEATTWEFIPVGDNTGYKPFYKDANKKTEDYSDDATPVVYQGTDVTKAFTGSNKPYLIQNVATGEFAVVPSENKNEASITPLYKINTKKHLFRFTPAGNFTYIESEQFTGETFDILGQNTDFKTSIIHNQGIGSNRNSTRWIIVDNGDGTYSFQSKMWEYCYLAYNDFYDVSPDYTAKVGKLCALRLTGDLPDEAKWRIYSLDDKNFPYDSYPAMPPLPNNLKPSRQGGAEPVTPTPNPETTPVPTPVAAPTPETAPDVTTTPTPTPVVNPTPIATPTPTPTPTPAPAKENKLEEGIYYITNTSDGQRLSCEIGSRDVRLWDPDDYFVQQWQVSINSNGNYVIKPVGTDLVLNYRARYRTGDIVDCTNPTTGNKSQEFVLIPNDDGSYIIQVSFNSYFTLVYDGLDVMCKDCTGQADAMNHWTFTKAN